MSLRGLLEFLRRGVQVDDIFERISRRLDRRVIWVKYKPENDYERGWNDALAEVRRVIDEERARTTIATE